MARAATRMRESAALEMLSEGRSYDEIASELGYANRSGVWKLINRALARNVVADIGCWRELELARLDALHAAHWERAVAGDRRSAEIILKVTGMRIRLLGLDGGIDNSGKQTSLIVGV